MSSSLVAWNCVGVLIFFFFGGGGGGPGGYAVAQLVLALCYNPGGRGFDSR